MTQSAEGGALIDGRALAARLRRGLARQVAVLREDHGVVPTLAVVLVGNDPASCLYVANKKRAAESIGIKSIVHHLPEETSQDSVLRQVASLSADPAVNGILVQLPLPRQIDTATVLRAINPAKDVDGLTIENAGRLACGLRGLVPCTPLGCLSLIRTVFDDTALSGKRAVVVGRSNLVGRPMAQLLLRHNCTVTIAHSLTRDLAEVTRTAEILVVAAGCPQLIGADGIKPGAVVIDVGIHHDADGGLVGDVRTEEVRRVARAVTPVPGGVGPMTIACLLANTLVATCCQRELAAPDVFAPSFLG